MDQQTQLQNRYAFLKSDIELSTDDKLSKAQRNLIIRSKCRDSCTSEYDKQPGCKQVHMRCRSDVKDSHSCESLLSISRKSCADTINIGDSFQALEPGNFKTLDCAKGRIPMCDGLSGLRPDKPLDFEKEQSSFSKCDSTVTEQIIKSSVTTKLQQDSGIIDSVPEQRLDTDVENVNGSNLILKNYWTVWIHKNSSTDWSLKGYNKVMSIKSIADFWKFINNFNKLMYANYQFFIMRNDITPTWEDPSNKFGGAASIKLSVTDSSLLSIWERICLQMICEKLYFGTSLSTDVNGASFNLKDTTTVIKIWNNDNRNDIVKKLSIVGINLTQEIGNFRTVGKPRCESITNPKYKIIYIKNRPDH